LDAGDVRADRGDHLVAKQIVFVVGVIGPVELGVAQSLVTSRAPVVRRRSG